MNYTQFSQNYVQVSNDLQPAAMDASKGTPGDFAHVYATMLRAYHMGIVLSNRQFSDMDAFAIQELAALARQAVNPDLGDRDAPMEAAKWATLKAAFSRQPRPKTGEELMREAMSYYGVDENGLEAMEFPGHWTCAEARTFVEYQRQREKEQRMEKQRVRDADVIQRHAEDAIGKALGQGEFGDAPAVARTMRPVQPADEEAVQYRDRPEPGPLSMDMGDREAAQGPRSTS